MITYCFFGTPEVGERELELMIFVVQVGGNRALLIDNSRWEVEMHFSGGFHSIDETCSL